MIADSLIVPQCIFRPGSFTGLMTLYESNYIKLSQLVSDLSEFPGTRPRVAVSYSATDCDLHLEVQLKEAYTTTLKMTYLFPPEEGSAGGADAVTHEPVPDPDLTVRIYHDARLVEAMKGREEHQHHKLRALAKAHSLELNWRWRNNMLLNKWLDYLLDMGHAFPDQSSG